mgnify:CR=1 FL=1
MTVRDRVLHELGHALMVQRSTADGGPLRPVTVFTSRYGGAYEGDAWVAVAMDYDELPGAFLGDDITCSQAFEACDGLLGVGGTASEAVADLAAKAGVLGSGLGSYECLCLRTCEACEGLVCRTGPRILS